METPQLLSGPVTLAEAEEKGYNVIHRLAYPQLQHIFRTHLQKHSSDIGALIAYHLQTELSNCSVSPPEYWRNGSFNICVPAVVSTPGADRYVMVRFPLPYRVGETTHPGNADEKLRCEAAAYAWLQEHCPSIPIPYLYGVGLSTGQQFTDVQCLPWWPRSLHLLNRFFRKLVGWPCPSRYVCRTYTGSASLGTGYLIIETITQGEMLSTSWDEKYDSKRVRNLSQGIARILLSLSAIPQPRIGSFRLRDDGYLSLDNRPLSVDFIMQENEGIALNIPREMTYTCVDEFVLDHLSVLSNRLACQPNAIRDRADGWYQMAGLAAARATFPHLFRRDLRHGPFVFSLTDLHKSNIIVDDEWNVICIIDLEFACSWPVEFQHPPYWLAAHYIDDVDEAAFDAYYDPFIQIVEEQEATLDIRSEKLSAIMRKSWSSGAFWVCLAISSPICFSKIFFHRILPYHFNYTEAEIQAADYDFWAKLWRPNSTGFIQRRVLDYENYINELHVIFSRAR